jgi:hypothetical protein
VLLKEHTYLLGSRAMTLRLRDLTDDERVEVQRITRSHTLGAAFVRRTQIVVHAMSGLKAEEITSRMSLCGNRVRYWINRFNTRGLDGLEEGVVVCLDEMGPQAARSFPGQQLMKPDAPKAERAKQEID